MSADVGGAALAADLGYPRPGEPSRLVSAVRAAASSPLGARVLSRTLRPADALLARWGGGRVSAPGLLAGLPVVTLTTTGARSGRRRRVPLIPVVTDRVFAVLGTNFGGERTPAWAVNLEALPAADLAFGGRTVPVRARLLVAAERAALLTRATELYPGFGRYVARAAHRDVRVFALERMDRSGTGEETAAGG